MPLSSALGSRVFPARVEEAPSSIYHGKSLGPPLGTYSLRCCSEDYVRGWLEGGLEVQEDWVGKLGICIVRLVGLGAWALDDWEVLPGHAVVSPFLRMRLLSS